MNRILLSSLALLCFGMVQAQDPFVCGTQTPPKQKITLPSTQEVSFTVPDLCLKKEVSIYAYIVKDSLGKANITEAAIQTAIAGVNTNFAPVCLSFKVCKFIYINNWQYDEFRKKKHEDEVRNLYCTPKIINMLFVTNILDPAGAAGYAGLPTSLPANPNDIVVIKKASATIGVITHEMGHFFGLYHTFETSFGAELADATNCVTAGDLICDTEADINPAKMTGCKYEGDAKDAKGDFYLPPIGNFMAYHPCSCKFTTGQYNKMAWVFLNYRKYLL